MKTSEMQNPLNKAYSERAIVIKMLVITAQRAGFKTGWGIDDHKDWEPEWRRVVYVQLPEGQFSWHIAPTDWPLFEGLQEFDGKWDHTFRGKDWDNAKALPFIPNNVIDFEGIKDFLRNFGVTE